MSDFDLFVGIDWSGDKKRQQKGIAVAIAKPGHCVPNLVKPSASPVWSRESVVDWLVAEVARSRILVGIDFAFGFPTLPVPEMGWADVDRHCGDDGRLYGGRFFSDRHHPYGPYVNGPWGQGKDYSARHHRLTEIEASRTRGASPSCMLNGVGPSAVGFSSASGMRALVRLRQRLGAKLSVWPFDEVDDEASVIVEIFPRLFPLLKSRKPAMKSVENLNGALAAYGSDVFAGPVASEDEGDAIISAAALRTISADAGLWSPLPPKARREGWIFGVPVP